MPSLGNKTKSDLLTCKACKKLFVDPLLLPCGENVCALCVTRNKKSANRSNIFSCNVCYKHHEIPDAGFSISQFSYILKHFFYI